MPIPTLAPPRISILIATYNRGAGLVRTLRSLTRQSLPYAEFEVVVANNNSSDDTVACFEAFRQEYPMMRVQMVFEARQGLSHARNCAITHSEAPYLAIIDDDEEVNPEFAASYCDFFDVYADVAACGGVVEPRYEFEVPRWLTPYAERPIAGTLYLGDQVRPFPKGRYPGGGNMAIRRAALTKYGAFNPNLGRTGTSPMGGEEKDLFARLRAGGESIYYVPGAVIYHLIPKEKFDVGYFQRLNRMGGVSERVRTRAEGGGSYGKRLLSEMVKWAATGVLLLGYTLRGVPIKGWYLVKMRWNITLGLLCGR